jgi:hypothetical protein
VVHNVEETFIFDGVVDLLSECFSTFECVCIGKINYLEVGPVHFVVWLERVILQESWDKRRVRRTVLVRSRSRDIMSDSRDRHRDLWMRIWMATTILVSFIRRVEHNWRSNTGELPFLQTSRSQCRPASPQHPNIRRFILTALSNFDSAIILDCVKVVTRNKTSAGVDLDYRHISTMTWHSNLLPTCPWGPKLESCNDFFNVCLTGYSVALWLSADISWEETAHLSKM